MPTNQSDSERLKILVNQLKLQGVNVSLCKNPNIVRGKRMGKS